ncbi:MAG: DUF1499 domain-containing protein [Leptolyngbyaceae cyanobacterium SL_5_9]|nr:DUF1499 domain-containing protein [Leptolyngbyaceae cyanobacterium SL_5_9]NJO73479.1 DUF1499 domain-containing protein [Leptolyngbyaceae cyanobacterium RM1_406_9]
MGRGGVAIAQPLSTATFASATASSGEKPLFSFSGTPPTNLGVKEGKLLECPSTPNCVNSQAPNSNSEHSIQPISYSSTPEQSLANLKAVIQDLPRTKIVDETEDYIYAEFTSALMGFVDDVEFYLDKTQNVIHVRSASRLGQSDLGVNRKRVEEIRAKFAALEA